MKKYDYLIVGAGLYGSLFAHLANKNKKKCLVIDKRPHLGGNLFCETIEGINVHKYGAHIFHTSNKQVWDFVNSITEFNRFINSPLACYKDRLFNLPFNMNTFYQLWGTKTPSEAKLRIADEIKKYAQIIPKNLEEQALSLVGDEIYNKLIKGYTEKQWGRDAKDLPAFIINRIPLRFSFDNNYFNDAYQGVPIGGYNKFISGLLKGIDVKTNTDFFENRKYWSEISDKIIFTGKIDEYFNYSLGKLDYRSLKFKSECLCIDDYQGNAVVNYTERDIPFTRIIEHKHFEFGNQPKTIITKEYPKEWKDGDEPYYPVNDNRNNNLYLEYRRIADLLPNIEFGGRLGEYKYYDMHIVVEKLLNYKF